MKVPTNPVQSFTLLHDTQRLLTEGKKNYSVNKDNWDNVRFHVNWNSVPV